MMYYLRSLLVFPKVKTRLSSCLRTQKKTILSFLADDLLESKRTNDNSLDESDYQKITDYYGLAVPVMIGESFCLLKGEKMTLQERLALTYLGGLTGLFDDFFDKKDIPESHLKKMLEYPQQMNGENSHEKLILKLYLKALEYSSDPERLKIHSLQVFQAQVLSKKQFSAELTQPEIQHITFQKGGNSVLFYLSSFHDEISSVEKELFYKIGCLWQIENDLLDVFKDYKAGIKTLATTETKTNHIRQIYIRLVDETVQLLCRTHYPATNKRHFLDSIMLFVSVGFVALDVLEANEKKTQGILILEKYERKDLICDLEKPVNILKIIHYFAKHNPPLPTN